MAMRSDSAHKWADRRLAAMEKRIEEIYAQAQEEVDKKLSDFTAQFQAKAKQKLADMKAGKIDAEEYKRWLRTQLFITDEWKLTRGMLADEYIHANQTALAYINGNMPEVWAVGYNAIGDAAESAMAGYTFHMVDAETVRLLTTDNSLLLPPPTKKLNLTKDERWNLKKINNQIRQGILQGESIGQIASRLQKVTDMNRTGALRNARTMVTAAENRGRMSSYERLERDGATVEREWIAAIDRRTRHAHQVLDGQKRKMGEAFVYDGDEIQYPGDPSAKPYLVYNCRCTVSAEVVAYKGRDVRTSYYEKGKEGDGTETFEKKRDEAEKRKQSRAHLVKTIDFEDEKEIMKALSQGERYAKGKKHEIAYTVTKDGNVWKTEGIEGFVDVSTIPHTLEDSWSYHNHPEESTWYSFSEDDVAFFISKKERFAKASDDLYEYTMERTAATVDAEREIVYNRFKEIYETDVRALAWDGLIDMDMDGYHETMKMIAEEYGFIYDRRKKNEKN